MNKMKFLGAGVLLIALVSFKASDDLPKAFIEILKSGELTFEKPKEMEERKIIENRQMNYEYALKYAGKNFEVRYAVRPLAGLMEEYKEFQKNKKEGDIMLNPNNLHSSLLRTTLLNITGGQSSEIQEFDKQAAKREFNADWGATAFVEVGKEFGQDYKYCMVVAIHKNDVADAYYFYLSDTKDDFSDLMLPAFHSMKFK